MKIFIAVANFNRGEIAKKCIYSLWKSKHKNDELVIFDDATTEYHPYDCFADRCNRCVVSSKNMGIHAQRREHIKEFIENSYGDYLYLTDNDCYHDPTWREQILKISKESGLIASLYNSPYHASHPEWIIEEKKDYLIRQYCAGISMLLTRDIAQKCYDKIPEMIEDEKKHREAGLPWCWDFGIGNFLQMPTAVSKISFCEHLGKGGLHNQNFEQDRALNPTKFLKVKRETLLRKLK